MKKFLLIMVMCLVCQNAAFGQRFGNAYKGLSIESESDYITRKSRDYSISFSTYSGTKSYIKCDFVDGYGYYRYFLNMNGFIYDALRDCSGEYFVGEETGHMYYPVYIRWNHGGEQVCYLDYDRRSDGWPVFKYVSSSGWKVFNPDIE